MHHCSLPQNYSPPLIHFLHPHFPQSATKHRPHCVNYASKYGTFFMKSKYRIMNSPTGVVSGFRHEVDENCVLLGCYAASDGNRRFGTDRLSREFCE